MNLSTENDRSKSTKEFDFRRKHRVVVTKRVPRKVGRKVKPENESTKFPLSVSMKRVAKTILSELPRYRPDLQNAALARAVRLVKAVKNIRTDEKAANVREEEQRARKANKQ